MKSGTFLAIYLLLAILFHTTEASSQEEDPRNTVIFGQDLAWIRISKADTFHIVVTDGVTDKCWTDARSTKTSIEIELNRSGFETVDTISDSSMLISINTTGYSTNKYRCIANYNIKVWQYFVDQYALEGHQATSIFRRIIWHSGGILSGPRNGINSQIRDAYVGLIQDFLVAIPKKKREIFEDLSKNSTNNVEKNYWSSR